MNLIVKVILTFVCTTINLILFPFNTIIESYMPGLTSALASVNSLLTWLQQFVSWAISWLPFDSNFYTFAIASLVLIYTLPTVVNAIKLVVKWWHALVP